MWWWFVLACDPVEERPLHFVRGGLVRAGQFEARAWTAGEVVEGVTAPRQPECIPLFSYDLGDVSGHVAAGGEAPDTALAFSPDGRWLAVGSFRGDVDVLDAWTGALRVRRHFDEAMIKRVAWSPDGGVLWVGEQSPDGFVYALDSATLREIGQFRLADELGGGEPPPGDDLYGRYALPGVYGLLADGDGAWVVGAHGWTDPSGIRHNRSRVWRLGAGATPLRAWPQEGPADAIFGGLVAGPDALVVPVRRSADGAPPAGVPIDGLAVLSRETTLRAEVTITPLIPWFSSVFVGDGLVVGGLEIWAGLGDGRLVRAPLAGGAPSAVLALGVPDPAASLPLAATLGWVVTSGPRIVAATTRTVIPYGAASPELRPPTLHPAENTVFAVERSGAIAWQWSGPFNVQGLVADEQVVVVGGGVREADDRRDLFGAIVLDAASGALIAQCPTSGPVFFRPALAPDGRIALAEHPFRGPGGVLGAYRVTVVR